MLQSHWDGAGPGRVRVCCWSMAACERNMKPQLSLKPELSATWQAVWKGSERRLLKNCTGRKCGIWWRKSIRWFNFVTLHYIQEKRRVMGRRRKSVTLVPVWAQCVFEGLCWKALPLVFSLPGRTSRGADGTFFTTDKYKRGSSRYDGQNPVRVDAGRAGP